MEAMSGNVIGAVQRVASPYAAPACEYVAIPEGSSSLAPVTSPGPSSFQKRNSLDDFFLLVIYRLFKNDLINQHNPHLTTTTSNVVQFNDWQSENCAI